MKGRAQSPEPSTWASQGPQGKEVKEYRSWLWGKAGNYFRENPQQSRKAPEGMSSRPGPPESVHPGRLVASEPWRAAESGLSEWKDPHSKKAQTPLSAFICDFFFSPLQRWNGEEMGDSEGNWSDDNTPDQPRGSEAAVQCRQISLRGIS